jgi:glucose/arabinose dehydrogenase
VVFVPFTNGRPSGKAQTFVGGFTDQDFTVRGRPVGLGFDAKGALLIADDGGGVIWRVIPKVAPTAVRVTPAG